MLDKMKELVAAALPVALHEQEITQIAQELIQYGAVVPVPCGKCRHWSPHNPGSDIGTCFCRGFNRGVERRKDGYCSRGEVAKGR